MGPSLSQDLWLDLTDVTLADEDEDEMQLTQSGGKNFHNTSCTTCWLNLETMQVAPSGDQNYNYLFS